MRGPCPPPPRRRKKTTLSRNIEKPSKMGSGNSVSENVKKRKEQGKWVENQQTRPITASRRE
jgi:hypothetical protein